MSAEMSSWIGGDAETVAVSNHTTSSSSSPSRIRVPGPQRAGAIGKKRKPRPRASKRVPTTYINADPANFRAMVQQVTGIRFGEAGRVGDGPQDPQRRSLLQFQYHHQQHQQQLQLQQQQKQSFLPPAFDASDFLAGSESGGEFDLESMLSFPTLDSWGVI